MRIAQSLNLVVGMTGDGVNDATALKAADVGFAMGSGTDVAKEAGDIIILDDNISSIANAISYGRTVFKNIRKFIVFQLSINFCAMAVSIIAPILSIDTPITVVQMLWINLVMDTLAGLAFGCERPREKFMKELPKRRTEPVISPYMWNQIIFSSIFTATVCIWFLKSHMVQNIFVGRGEIYAQTAFFVLFIFISIFNSFNARTNEVNLFDCISLNKPFVFIMLSVGVIQIILIYFGGAVFRTTAISFLHLSLVLVIALSIIPADMIRKRIINKRYNSL
ncbi:MAG: HAD-IC family P-type ATPase [Firmicutes bacterium]|nr:HAD-IC family P-type ATPase [Bacillota bacterium]